MDDREVDVVNRYLAAAADKIMASLFPPHLRTKPHHSSRYGEAALSHYPAAL